MVCGVVVLPPPADGADVSQLRAARAAAVDTTTGCNERGEVLITVLSESESAHGLEPLAKGLIDRYGREGRPAASPGALYQPRLLHAGGDIEAERALRGVGGSARLARCVTFHEPHRLWRDK